MIIYIGISSEVTNTSTKYMVQISLKIKSLINKNMHIHLSVIANLIMDHRIYEYVSQKFPLRKGCNLYMTIAMKELDIEVDVS